MKIKKEIQIGVVFVVVLILSIWGFNFLKGRNILKTSNSYVAIYPNIKGLAEANPVFLNGYKVGQVSEIKIIPDKNNDLLVEFKIEEDIKIPIHSTASIHSDIMGTSSIKLSLSDQKKIHKEGDTLKSYVETGLSEKLKEQISPLKQKTEELITSLDIFINDVFNEKNKKNISESFQHLNTTTESLSVLLKHEKESLANISNNLESITQTIKENNQEIAHTIKNMRSVSDSLEGSNLKSAINSAESSLKEMESILSKINNKQGTLGELVNNDTLYQNLENVSKELDVLIKDIHKNPKRYIQFSVFGSQ